MLAGILLSLLFLLRGGNAPQENIGLLLIAACSLWMLRREVTLLWNSFRERKRVVAGAGTPAVSSHCAIAFEKRGIACSKASDFLLVVSIHNRAQPDALPIAGKILCCGDHHPNRNAGNGLGRKCHETEEYLREKNLEWTEVVSLREQKTLGLGG